jgi:two-component system, sensor histidine kinase and response regulator
MEAIDWQALKDNCAGDDGLVTEILELFRKEAPALLADVQKAVVSHEAVAIRRSAHRLKGALVSLAAQPATLVARDLEVAGAQNDLSQVNELQSKLDAEMQRLLGVLQSPPRS